MIVKNVVSSVGRKILHGGDPRMYVLRKMPKGSVCAEIGVWKGQFSRSILDVTDPKELHLVDPWAFQDEYPDRMYGGKEAKGQKDMDDIFEAVKTAFAEDEAVHVHRGSSKDVLISFEDETFDWIYVDGNHYYGYVLEDLRLSYEKIKKGG
ncbi:hypothetical protein GJ672_09030 [Spiribacter sp. 2438]|uniref:class I SAM-dependent methyltransferase n=1 Tax=Spiribacter sp. 2438 TaxID=2666185 RepID=UPI0012AF5E84|nr:class I SAM-dependent methyltransferase [Spiribacter sp. 2438]QGM22381.1 hypothetical protein GJ672_09030 [Spiribacter sp. 2438]